MQYALLIYETPGAYDGLTRTSAGVDRRVPGAPRRLARRRRRPPAARDTATTVRVADGEPLITDGPFADTKEVLRRLLRVEADDLDAALEFARTDPGGAARRRGRGPPARGAVSALIEQVFRASGAASSRPWSASSATSTSPRRPPRRRSRSPPSAGRATACRSTRWPGW